MAILSPTTLVISVVTILISRRIYYETTTGRRRRLLAAKHGTLPAPSSVSSPPWFLPTFGLDSLIANFRAIKAHRFLEHWQHELSAANAHTISVYQLGQQLLLTDDPENVKQVLATGFGDWRFPRERVVQMSAFLGEGVFTNEGAKWKHSREMLRPCFEKHAVADVALFEKHVQRMTRLLPEDGSTVDLLPLLHELTLDVATEFLFGRSTDALVRGEKRKDVDAFVEAFEYCCDPFQNENYAKWGYLGFFLPDRKAKRCAQALKDFADKIIDEEITSKTVEDGKTNSRYIFLDELLAATQDRTVIRSELLNILLAGRDTTAALLSNLLLSLSQNPSILSSLRSEISSTIGPVDTPTYAQLKDLKYLRACINESQRLHPIVPSNSRQATSDTTLPRGGGPDHSAPILVPKGTVTAYHVYSMHRRADIFGPDPDVFRPERWLAPQFRPGWGYIPFSGGPRVCIGQNFAMTETMYVVVRLLQMYELERREWGVWREKLSITCVGEAGCKVGLKRREGLSV